MTARIIGSFRFEDEDEDEDEALCFHHNEIFKLFRLQPQAPQAHNAIYISII